MRTFLALLLILAGCTTAPTITKTLVREAAPVPVTRSGDIPAPVYGWTIDSAWDIQRVLDTLSKLQKKTTLRIVLDPGVDISEYLPAFQAFSKKAYIMAQIADSTAMKQYTQAQYLERTKNVFKLLKPYVDVFEIANEWNGIWSGPNALQNGIAAYDYIKSQGGKTAVTLYYNSNQCWSQPSEEMFSWADKNIPGRIKLGTDYILISYYEADCENQKVRWQTVFENLATMFPLSKIGFGEVGTAQRVLKSSYMKRYYTTKITVPNYIGGWFWWWGFQDLTPSTAPLFNTFNGLLQ